MHSHKNGSCEIHHACIVQIMGKLFQFAIKPGIKVFTKINFMPLRMFFNTRLPIKREAILFYINEAEKY